MSGLVEAFGELMTDSRFNEYSLVFAGKAGWKVDDFLSSTFDFFDRKRILFTGFVDEEDKKEIYSRADLFVYPSFFEGFGFPLVEAALARTPIISSAHSSIFEIIGNGAMLVDPVNVHELARAMKLILLDAELGKIFVERAHQGVSRFSTSEPVYEKLMATV